MNDGVAYTSLLMDSMRLHKWVDDLQSKMYVNCVFCGFNFGPNTQDVPRIALTNHMRECTEHPLYKACGALEEILEMATMNLLNTPEETLDLIASVCTKTIFNLKIS